MTSTSSSTKALWGSANSQPTVQETSPTNTSGQAKSGSKKSETSNHVSNSSSKRLIKSSSQNSAKSSSKKSSKSSKSSSKKSSEGSSQHSQAPPMLNGTSGSNPQLSQYINSPTFSNPLFTVSPAIMNEAQVRARTEAMMNKFDDKMDFLETIEENGFIKLGKKQDEEKETE